MSTLRIIFKRRCCMRGVRLTCPVACGVCQASPHLALAGILTFCLCPFLFPSTCRRSPVAALPITSWPPQWCCGCRPIKLALVPWTWGGASPDRYGCVLQGAGRARQSFPHFHTQQPSQAQKRWFCEVLYKHLFSCCSAAQWNGECSV